MANSHISLNPSAVARVVGTVAFCLVLASIGGALARFVFGHDYVWGLVPLFDVVGEQNIPTFFSVLLLLFAALLLAVIAMLNVGQTHPHGSKWAILSFGFLLMAYDEAFQVHELLGPPVETLLGGGRNFGGVLSYAWVIPGIALVFGLALFFLRFLLHLPVTTRRTFLMAAILYIGGAIGFELIEGRYGDLYGWDRNLTNSMISTVEESLEMAGVIIFIWALLVYIANNHKEVRFGFDGVPGLRPDQRPIWPDMERPPKSAGSSSDTDDVRVRDAAP